MIPRSAAPAAVLAALALGCGRARTGERAIAFVPCQLSSPGSPGSVPAQCGTLAVPEDRAAPGGRTIKLRVAVAPALSGAPKPDPVYLLAGGPGQAATEAFVPFMRVFDRIRKDRDLVLVDQRGTGKSNPLRCPPPGAEGDFSPLGDAALKTWADECLKKLDADPRFYTTSAAIEDLDAVRAALGHERVNLYGVSYGTRVALAYLRRHPERVRTVALDGVVPPELVLGPGVARDAERALDMVFARCAADAACHKAHPDPRADLAALSLALDKEPARFKTVHPVSGAPVDVTLTRPALGTAVRLLSYSAETAALLPLLLHDARERGDLSRLAAQALLVRDELDSSMANGMGISVLCAEDVPLFPDKLDDAISPLLGDLDVNEMVSTCRRWPRGEMPADFHALVRSDVPALLLSGEADPVTPPANGEAVLRGLPNGVHVVGPQHGHGLVHRGCVPQLLARFIAAGSARDLDTGCVKELRPQAFFLDFVGPEP